MINSLKLNSMPKGWNNSIKVDVENELKYFSDDDGIASAPLSHGTHI